MFSRKLMVLLGVLVVLAGVTVAGVTARPPADKTAKIQEDWSRARRVGVSPVNQTAALSVSDDGKRIHLAWVGAGAGGLGIQYVQLNEHAQTVAQQWLGPMDGTPQSIQIVRDAQGRPQLFATGRLPAPSAGPSTELIDRLVHASLNTDGSPRVALHPVSPPTVSVSGYAALVRRDGTIGVFWAADPESDARGVYAARLDADGQTIDAPNRLNARPASELSAQVDGEGIAHLVWGERFAGPTKEAWRKLVYAHLEEITGQPVEGIEVGQATAQPRLGLDGDRAYIFWGEQIRGGADVGTGFTRYISFPLRQPPSPTLASLWIPFSGTPRYLPYAGEYHLTALAKGAPQPGKNTTDSLHSPYPVQGQREQVAVVTIASLTFGLDTRAVPTLVVLRGAEVVGYQVIGYDEQFMWRPVVAANDAGDLYAAWLIGGTQAGFQVYYAASTNFARAQLDPLDGTDILLSATSLVWSMAAGIALLPFLPLLLIPAFAILLGYVMFGHGTEALVERSTFVMLAVICLAYWVTKEVFLGPIVAEPILALGLAGWAQTAVVWALQLSIAGIAALVTARLILRRRITSIFGAALVFVGCDFLLTMLAAGPTLAMRG